MTIFEITGVRIGDGLDSEDAGEVITEFRYNEAGSGDLYASKAELIHIIKNTENAAVHAVSASGSFANVVVVTPNNPLREPFLRTVGDRSAANDLLSLPRF